MAGQGGTFSDLTVRATTGVVMAVVGLGAVWQGGIFFLGLAAIASGVMLWELTRMLHPDAHPVLALGPAALAALVVLAAYNLSAPRDALAALAVVGFAPFMPAGRRGIFAVGGVAIVAACLSLVLLRQADGPVWMLWLVLVVVASDVAGYFVGRYLGGPKFWPRISPKKTWSGTVAGWVASALVGLAVAASLEGVIAPTMMAVSVVTCMAAQFGDIGESWIKRRAEVKDSSQILPGHGGVMDRFDALIGAALFLLLYQQFLPFPPLVGG